MTDKTIETKVLGNTSGDVLRWFCMENAEHIVGCGWYKSKLCLKNCKFYNNQVAKETEAAGEYFGGSAENSTNTK